MAEAIWRRLVETAQCRVRVHVSMCGGRGEQSREVAVYLALFCSIMISLKSRRRRVQYLYEQWTHCSVPNVSARLCLPQSDGMRGW
jgi:hypothetical protein